MRHQEIWQRLSAHREELANLGVKSLALFGSAARGEARPDSALKSLPARERGCGRSGYGGAPGGEGMQGSAALGMGQEGG